MLVSVQQQFEVWFWPKSNNNVIQYQQNIRQQIWQIWHIFHFSFFDVTALKWFSRFHVFSVLGNCSNYFASLKCRNLGLIQLDTLAYWSHVSNSLLMYEYLKFLIKLTGNNLLPVKKCALFVLSIFSSWSKII